MNWLQLALNVKDAEAALLGAQTQIQGESSAEHQERVGNAQLSLRRALSELKWQIAMRTEAMDRTLEPSGKIAGEHTTGSGH